MSSQTIETHVNKTDAVMSSAMALASWLPALDVHLLNFCIYNGKYKQLLVHFMLIYDQSNDQCDLLNRQNEST